MNASQIIRQMESDMKAFATKHPQQTAIVAEKTEKLNVLKREIANLRYLEAGLRVANEEIEKRKTNGPLNAQNQQLKQQLADKSERLRQYIEYPRTECPKPLKQQHSLFLTLFLNVGLPALRKNPEGIPALLKSGILQKEAQQHPLLNDLITELQKISVTPLILQK